MRPILTAAVLLFKLLYLITGCSKQHLPEASSGSVTSYNFYAVGGLSTPDNGFIVYCNEAIHGNKNLTAGSGAVTNDKIVKIGPDGSIQWQYYNRPHYTNDSNYTNYNITGLLLLNDGYGAVTLIDSMTSAPGYNSGY